MVSFNFLLSVAVAITGATRAVQADSLVQAIEALEIVVYDASAPTPAKRDIDINSGSIAGRISKRHPATSIVDPYAGWSCAAWYPLRPIPSNPTCNANNCYRAFLNARKGSKGFHCPSVAYDYCCQWYSNSQANKESLVEDGTLFYYLPWTENCGAAGPFNRPAEIKAVVAKVDDVCACTIRHKVKVTLPNDYAALTPKGVADPVCEQDL